MQFMRQVQLAQWQKTLPQRRTRNIMTGLGIGALVLAVYGYTFYSVTQERFFYEMEDEAKAAQARALERERELVKILTVRTIFKLLEPLYMLNDAWWSPSNTGILTSDYD